MKPHRSKKSVARYPWERWFRRQRFRLRPEIEYYCLPHSMAVLVRGAAKRKGLCVRIDIQRDGVLWVTIKE